MFGHVDPWSQAKDVPRTPFAATNHRCRGTATYAATKLCPLTRRDGVGRQAKIRYKPSHLNVNGRLDWPSHESRRH